MKSIHVYSSMYIIVYKKYEYVKETLQRNFF